MAAGSSGTVLPCVVVYAPRERARALARAVFPRRRVRLVAVPGAEGCAAALRSELVDAVVIDAPGAGEEGWRVAALARDFPSAPFLAMTALRAADGPALARWAELEVAELLVDGVDDEVARALVEARAFTTRFARALAEPPPGLCLTTPLQVTTWRAVVAQAGRAVRTDELARGVGVSREHLSRTFASGGAPNLKRVIDLVRLIAASELAKNPGYDVRDVARVLGFASASHLGSTAQRVVGTGPASLARLRTGDLVERFTQGRGRSRADAER